MRNTQAIKLVETRRKHLLSSILCAGLLSIFALSATAQVKKAPAPIPSMRTIVIAAEPDAVVWLDNIRYGKTDEGGRLEIKTVSKGQRALRVRADGFKEFTQTVAPTQKGEIKIVLTKTTDEAELTFQAAEKMLSSDRAAAAELYRKAIKTRPKYPEAYLALGRVLSDMQNLEEALTAIKQARRQRLAYAEASAVEGRIYKESGEEDLAIASFKRAITEGKGFQPEALTGLGLLYKEKAEAAGGAGDFEQEEADYMEATKYLQAGIKQLSGAPDAEVLFQLLGLVYERMKKYDQAIATYEDFLRMFPDSSEATAVRSFIVQIKKQMSEQ